MQTLIKITHRVTDAQVKINDSEVYINLEGFFGKNLRACYDRVYRNVQKIKMSITLSVVENSKKNVVLV